MGPIHEAGRLAAAAIAAAEGGEPQPPRSPSWGDPEVLRRWFAPAAVTVRDEQLAFGARSLELWLHEHHAHHPMWRSVRTRLERAGSWPELERRVGALFEQANEDPHAFCVTSRYLLTTVTKPAV